ncbi:hypothetical protein [Prosthecobacter vanneervenii]|uniref:Uncharacterized protein n=1 Tax=Prosthecobacter vanneervenii TaxID=48466 RepID=A0A7W7YBI4_9BACT|nr:hypothetical protein [Prosthecobacter vanneervenii]MBB5033173.1 hypothetical protein [Prosthecobacter vanneervenii]
MADTTTPLNEIDASALPKIKALFDDARWQKIEAQARKQSADLPKLCSMLLATSLARHASHEPAALASAANRLLISLGSTLKPEDVQRYEQALNPAQAASAPAADAAPDEAATKPKRGGKADPAPAPAN